VDTFAQFGVTKGALPITMANLSLAPMICIFSHTGFQDAADGASHQSLSYLAMTMSLPHTQVFCLSSSSEARQLLAQAIAEFSDTLKNGKTPDTYIFFLGREDFAQSYSDATCYLDRGQVLHKSLGKNANVVLATSGSLVPEALKAAETLSEHQIGCIVLNLPNVKNPDIELVKDSLKEARGPLFYLEDHQKIGGAGQRLFASLIESGVCFAGKIFAVEGEFGRSAYSAQELYVLHGLDGQSVAKKIKNFVP
jgi:transketolase